MADSTMTGLPTVELLTRAADAAGKASALADGPVVPWSEVVARQHDRLTRAKIRLIAASGPDHWRAVEAMLRAMLQLHRRVALNPGFHGEGDYCAQRCDSTAWPCPSLEALHPLAEQVLRDLGETP